MSGFDDMPLSVIFDMDGLMFDTERIYADMERRIAREWGLEGIEEIISESYGVNTNLIRKMYYKKYGDDFDYQGFLELTIKYVYEYYETHEIPVKPGLYETLDLLDELGCSKAVATSTFNKHAISLLKAADVHDRFDVIVTGDMVEKSKPAPDIFLRASKLLETAPVDCVVLEDSFNGIRGAHAAGMIPIMIPDIKKPTPEIKQLTYAVYDSLSDAHELLITLRENRF